MQRSSLSFAGRLHFLIVWSLPSGCYKFRELVLELRNANDHVLEVLDHEAPPDHSDIVSHGFKSDLPAVVNESREPSPSFVVRR